MCVCVGQSANDVDFDLSANFSPVGALNCIYFEQDETERYHKIGVGLTMRPFPNCSDLAADARSMAHMGLNALAMWLGAHHTLGPDQIDGPRNQLVFSFLSTTAKMTSVRLRPAEAQPASSATQCCQVSACVCERDSTEYGVYLTIVTSCGWVMYLGQVAGSDRNVAVRPGTSPPAWRASSPTH